MSRRPTTSKVPGGPNPDFEAKLRQLKRAQTQAVKIARVAGNGELKLEEASTKLAIQLIMEMLVVMKELKGRDSQRVVKVLDVLARLQASNVLREKLKNDFRRAVGKAKEKLLAEVKRAVGRNERLRGELEQLIESHAAELAK